ncbi:MAG: hypothetical protein KGZ37_00950 [Nitrosarchaeum sp.]|nr:hypothetical protein [Nitrosarchaeum sp.]
MSDEFLTLATAEINNEIAEIQNILNSCHDNFEISKNVVNFQKSTHKIKGLAPMMGKTDLGNFSGILDSIFKKIIDGAVLNNLSELISLAVTEMKNSMVYPDYSLDKSQQHFLQISYTLS